jgi:hypothetical protein
MPDFFYRPNPDALSLAIGTGCVRFLGIKNHVLFNANYDLFQAERI